jgi:hypothetical protein
MSVIDDLKTQVPTHPPTDQCPDPECMVCGIRDCPHGEPLHYHHDGCPACYTAIISDIRISPATEAATPVTAGTDLLSRATTVAANSIINLDALSTAIAGRPGVNVNELVATVVRLREAARLALELTTRYARPTDDAGYQFSNRVTAALVAALPPGSLPACDLMGIVSQMKDGSP